ncbi:uncharacterized protein [Gossypium hirsutum]|uniref:Retrotransposon gag domain-containing protein n=1 Tax=Gossypium hirsutum TaxID=3635 RepID=A0A1U8IAF3_GOSHI|nr:uncharacterized protein LOC107894323 [Gossypium hirsutum]
MEATERIMDNLDFTAEQKLKGTVSLLRDKVYEWWLTVKEGTHPARLTWDLFNMTFQSKYVGAIYIDARRREFLNLTQGDRTVAEYKAEFLRMSRYARGMVASEYERCVYLEEGLRDNLRNRDRKRGKNKRDSEPSSFGLRPKKKARSDGPMRVRPPAAPTGVALCGHCGRCHLGGCWRAIGAYLRCGSTEHCVRDCPLRIDQM